LPTQNHIQKSQQPSQAVGNRQSGSGATLPAVPIIQQYKEGTENDLSKTADDAMDTLQSNGTDNDDPSATTGIASFTPVQKKKNTSTLPSKPVAGFSPATAGTKLPLQMKDDPGLEKEEQTDELETVSRFVPSENPKPSAGDSVSQANHAPIQRKVFITGDGSKPPYDMPESEIAGLKQSAALNQLMRSWITGRRDHSFVDQMKMIRHAQEVMHGLTYNGTLKSVADEITKGLAGAKLLSDDILLDILKRPFEANWFKAKACLAMGNWPSVVETPPPHDGCIDMMEALVDMRSRKWDSFYKIYHPKAKAELKDPTLDIPPPDGSQSVTSDIDLSVKGAQSEAAVEYFNTMFKSHFGVAFEPGTMFDINLYSLDWMHGQDETISEKDKEGNRASTIVPAKENNLQALNLNAMTDRAATQETWSYVKIMRNLSTTEITAYKADVLKAFTPPLDPYIKMAKKLDDAEQETIRFKANVDERAEEMKAAFDAKMLEKGLDSKKSAFKTGANAHESEAHFQEEALKMSASNAIYQETIKEVKKIRTRIKTVKDGGIDPQLQSIENLAKLLANKIAEALTYANEVYASEGGVLHTVYGKQKADKKKAAYAAGADTKDIKTVKTVLSKEQYIQSVNENVGDSVHSLNHYGHMPKYAAFRSGKYLDRLCEATELLDERLAPGFPHYDELKLLGTTAAKEKTGKLGADPLAANDHVLFGTFDPAGIATLKQHILTFGAAVTSHFNRS
jgi:hypothetical protein